MALDRPAPEVPFFDTDGMPRQFINKNVFRRPLRAELVAEPSQELLTACIFKDRRDRGARCRAD